MGLGIGVPGNAEVGDTLTGASVDVGTGTSVAIPTGMGVAGITVEDGCAVLVGVGVLAVPPGVIVFVGVGVGVRVGVESCLGTGGIDATDWLTVTVTGP